jgi:hypothetical protein
VERVFWVLEGLGDGFLGFFCVWIGFMFYVAIIYKFFFGYFEGIDLEV